MKKMIVVLAASLLAFSLAAVAVAADEKPATDAKKVATEGNKPSVKKEKTTRLTATVEAVDLEKRIVTVKGESGNIVDIKAGDQVRNLGQVKVGDLVEVVYYESIAVKVFKPGAMPDAAGAAVVTERAKPGEKPAGAVGAQVTVTATVESISPKKTSVTLKMADGKSKVVKVENKKNLDNVKVGDEVMITATETLAIAVKPAKKK